MSNVTDRQKGRTAGDLGELTRYLEDPTIAEVMRNPDGALWVQTVSGRHQPAGRMSDRDAYSLIYSLSGISQGVINDENPILETVLEGFGDDIRVQAAIPPVVNAPQFSIRIKRCAAMSLSDLVDCGTVMPDQRKALLAHVKERKSIAIVGSTSSGKTTLLNAMVGLIAEACPNDRIISIEDTKELEVRSPNSVSMFTSESAQMSDLVKAALRANPDRIIVGEVRGMEALDMIQAWMTGHPGMATFHATTDKGPAPIFRRLESMMTMGGITERRAHELASSAIDVIVAIDRTDAGRKVIGIYESGKDWRLE